MNEKSDQVASLSTEQSPMTTGLEGFTGYLLKQAFNAIQADLAAVLEPFGLRMLSFSALVAVARNPDIIQSQLGQLLSIERSNVVLVVDGLEEAGYLSRNPVPNNRRAYALRATLEGQRVEKKARDAVLAHENRMFGALSQEDRASLPQMLRSIADQRL